MDLEQLTGRYRRLKQELADAHVQQPLPARLIDRLEQEIAETEQAIAVAAGATVQASAGVSGAQRSQVRRNRLTPFGQRVAEAASE